MLRLEKLAAVRGERLLFAGLACAIEPGEAVHLVGANGSGKTTLLRILAGLMPPTAGRVLWRGKPLADDAGGYARDMAWLGYRNALKPELTAMQSLRDAALFEGRPATESALLSALDRVGMRNFADLPVAQLSQGQQRRVALARVAACQATLWLLDEPTTALDSIGVGIFHELCQQHLTQGGMLVFANHQALQLDTLPVKPLVMADFARATALQEHACSLSCAI